MKNNRKQILLLVFMLSFITSLFSQEKGFKKATKIAERLVKRKKVPGLAITVAQNGKTIFTKGFGFANIEKQTSVDPINTVFRIGSVSKPIAATALARLIQKRKIDIDQSLSHFLPDYPIKQADFTLKQLGGHLAGIRNYQGNEFMNNKPLSIEEGVNLFKNDSLLFTPNTNYTYSSYNFNLLSLAMQKSQQKSFESIVRDEVLAPLNMHHTFADVQQNMAAKAVFYQKKSRREFEEVAEVHNYFKLAAGGYLSTSNDISKLGIALLDTRFLEEKTRNEITTSQKVNGKLTYYGVGFQTSYDHKNRPYFGHVGNGLGGYGIFYVYPNENVVVSILSNCSNPKQDKKFNKIIDAFFEEVN